MCKSWVQFVFNLVLGVVLIPTLNKYRNSLVDKSRSYTLVISFLSIVYTSSKSIVLYLLNKTLYTQYTGLIITRAFLNNLFFITNNMGVKL